MSSTEPPISLSGPLTVAACEALHGELAQALARADDVVVALDSQAEVDLTFLQLLVAATRSAQAQGKRIALAAPPAGAFADALRICGLPAAPGATSLTQIFALQGGRA